MQRPDPCAISNEAELRGQSERADHERKVLRSARILPLDPGVKTASAKRLDFER
jgi:hypothetical protein